VENIFRQASTGRNRKIIPERTILREENLKYVIWFTKGVPGAGFLLIKPFQLLMVRAGTGYGGACFDSWIKAITAGSYPHLAGFLISTCLFPKGCWRAGRRGCGLNQ